MKELNLPQYSFTVRNREGKDYIFDNQRKKYVVLTPEEWVRQNFVRFLVEERRFPAGRIAIEKSLIYNKLLKRCDILAYGCADDPLVLIECKAPAIAISKKAFDQVALYNVNLRVPYLIVTNGMKHYCARVDFHTAEISFLKDIPYYTDLISGE